MKNFLQKNCSLFVKGFMCLFMVSIATENIAQSDVIGKEFSIVNDEKNMADDELLSFDAVSYVESIGCTWSGNFSASMVGFELQRAAKTIDFTTIATIAKSKICGHANSFCFEDKNVEPNTKYFYRLKYTSNNNLSVYSTIISARLNSHSVLIAEASPNPYKNSTTIQYLLSNPSLVTVEISNESGKVVKRIQQGLQKAGRYTLPFSAKEAGLSAGKYFVTVWFDDEHYQLSITETD